MEALKCCAPWTGSWRPSHCFVEQPQSSCELCSGWASWRQCGAGGPFSSGVPRPSCWSPGRRQVEQDRTLSTGAAGLQAADRQGVRGECDRSQPAVRGLYGASLGRCSPHHGEVRSHAPMLAEWRAVSPSVQSDRAHSLVRGGCPLRASRQRQERSARLREPSMTSRECFCSQSPHRQQWCLGLP